MKVLVRGRAEADAEQVARGLGLDPGGEARPVGGGLGAGVARDDDPPRGRLVGQHRLGAGEQQRQGGENGAHRGNLLAGANAGRPARRPLTDQ